MGISPLLVVEEEATLRDCLGAIDTNGIGAVLIVDPSGHLLGLATDGDIRRALLSGASLESPIKPVMNPSPVVAHEGMRDDEIRALLTEGHRHIPVLDQAGKVTRLISSVARGIEGMVPRIPVAAPVLGDAELRYVTDAVRSGWVSSQGAYVKRFEEEFARFCGTSFALSTTNGTAALHLCLAALGLGPGDEVLVPSLSFIAVANAASYCGATPVFVDSNEAYWCLDPDDMKSKISDRTKALVAVHLYGHPVDMGAVMELARSNGIVVIEDAAEAHGARYEGRPVGSIGAAGCFSFYGNKIITTGEGGMVVTDNEELWERMQLLRNHGMSPKEHYLHPDIGFNYRMTNLQAALGVAQLERVGESLEERARIAATYSSLLRDIPGITLPPNEAWAEPVCWLYGILVGDEYPLSATQLRRRLADHGIETRPFFRPLHLQPPYRTTGSLPVAERIATQGLSLPSTEALSEDDISLVASLIRSFGSSES